MFGDESGDLTRVNVGEVTVKANIMRRAWEPNEAATGVENERDAGLGRRAEAERDGVAAVAMNGEWGFDQRI